MWCIRAVGARALHSAGRTDTHQMNIIYKSTRSGGIVRAFIELKCVCGLYYILDEHCDIRFSHIII